MNYGVYIMKAFKTLLVRTLTAALLTVLASCGGGGGETDTYSVENANDAKDPALAVFNDPGIGPWELVATEALIEECGLDPDILASVNETAPFSYAIVRYGKLCHEFYRPDMPGKNEPVNNYSSTKTLAATLIGRAVLMSEDLPKPLRDTDRMDAWIKDISFNPDAQVAHVLAMLGSNEDLSFGQRIYSYDADGSREINRLSDVVAEVIAQDSVRFSGTTTAGEFAQLEIFNRLGMNMSEWTGESFASTWHSNLRDMARLGTLLVHDGVWGQQRLISSQWIYKMTHPAFEDANTGYGYLTWVASNRNYSFPRIPDIPVPIGSCQPPAIWKEFPHTLSESYDCNYDGEYSCLQTYDVGVFGGIGFGGQNITAHRGLDLVIVTRNAGRVSSLTTAWDLIRTALVEHDPMYAGDEDAFCNAYREGDYAPDLISIPEQ
jgi:hypothetical protein